MNKEPMSTKEAIGLMKKWRPGWYIWIAPSFEIDPIGICKVWFSITLRNHDIMNSKAVDQQSFSGSGADLRSAIESLYEQVQPNQQEGENIINEIQKLGEDSK